MAPSSSSLSDDPSSSSYIPCEARAVPQSEIVHIIQFKRMSYPLTDRPTELWIVETNQDRHEQWRSLEGFLTTLHLTCDEDTIHQVANQWRRYYEVPTLHHRDRLPHRRHLLPHPHQSNTHFEQPVSVVPDHTQLLQACWGRSASRHSQGDPSPSFSMMTLYLRVLSGFADFIFFGALLDIFLLDLVVNFYFSFSFF